ncbi:GNAT family N-acetyltransferase [Brachybacterium sp. EF45031]|uniref:GNAT family N-acetyltransferase n=1 Tax=Brachybacterium sillae TaxID=2810536 RepID=UPI00217CFFFF|nr:GNAT family N-acetyltransferase [Brachybacterium sillae]MCS6711355.1 GNAT family N-acetyltransferase [Brachybacterium sillae]
MLLTDHFPPVLPEILRGELTTRLPIDADVEAVARLMEEDRRRIEPGATIDREGVRSRLVGTRSWSRRQVVVVAAEADGSPREGAEPVGWMALEDRAAGRVNLTWVLPASLPHRAELARALFAWADAVGGAFARHRQVPTSIINDGRDARDEDHRAVMVAGGYEKVRTWLHMERPVTPQEATTTPPPREGVRVRRVRRHESGLPLAQDVRWVHIVLEESFEDHFNSYPESFSEFVTRMSDAQDVPWDHWWIAEVQQSDGSWWPGGGLVADVMPARDGAGEGTYLEYLGVHRTARGRGVAKALLRATIRDAAERGRTRIGLEVDDDSPTRADELYRSMGWETVNVSESWHREVPSVPSNLEAGAA